MISVLQVGLEPVENNAQPSFPTCSTGDDQLCRKQRNQSTVIQKLEFVRAVTVFPNEYAGWQAVYTVIYFYEGWVCR